MNLEFRQEGKRWVAEFAVDKDFNLHIEKSENGSLVVYQRTTPEGKYDAIRINNESYDKVFDSDFVGVIYPKYIKVECASKPTMAIVTVSEGGEVGYSEAQIAESLNTPV